jgi:hypothetical protein
LQRVIQYPHAKWSGKVSQPQKREDAQTFFFFFTFFLEDGSLSRLCVCVCAVVQLLPSCVFYIFSFRFFVCRRNNKSDDDDEKEMRKMAG